MQPVPTPQAARAAAAAPGPAAAAAPPLARRRRHAAPRDPHGACHRPAAPPPPASRVTRRHAVLAAAAAPGSVLTTRQLVLSESYEEVFEPSNDLRELAAAQLQSLFQVLARLSPAHPGAQHTCRACVYARRADSLDTPTITLQRVACCKSAGASWHGGGGDARIGGGGGGGHSFEELDELLTLHRAAWELGQQAGAAAPAGGGSSSGAAGGGCDPEASLINEEVVLLPSSNLLVLPLAEAGVLVGLMVVEVAGVAAAAAADAGAGAQRQRQRQAVWEPPPVLGLAEDVLWALRTAVPPLAKACAMDLRSSLAGAQLEARQRLARSLLTEAKGPLKVLGTFGQMLAPRLRTEPEQDMADGMLLQGQRLADVVAQLEAALRPAARAADVAPLALAGASSSGWQQQQQLPWGQEQLALPPGPPTTDDGNLSDEDDLWAFDSSTPQPASSSSSSSSIATAARHAPGAPPPPDPKVELLSSASTRGSIEASSRDIRWSDVEAAAPKQRQQPSSVASTAAYLPAGSFDAAHTIDLEPVQLPQPAERGQPGAAARVAAGTGQLQTAGSGDSTGTVVSFAVPPAAGSGSSSSSSSGGRELTTRQQSRQQPQQQPPGAVQRGLCNVTEVLSALLSAAAKLAAMQGVNLIVNDPLRLDDGGSSNDGAAASNKPAAGSALSLLPRPVRPLLAGIAGGVCQRVLGYCVDVALQCTPRGGQLCVTARESSGGVEVCLMHTGHAQPSRLHTSSAALEAAARFGGTTAAPAPAAIRRALERRSSKRLARGGGGGGETAAGSSSSSRWSLGMQELSSAAGLRGGSSVITLDLAHGMLQSLGGRLSLTYPHSFMNAITGQLEVGSSIEVWLPPPAPTS